MNHKPLTIIGSYNVGLFLKGDNFPVPGETIIASYFIEGAGGKGSNQAVTAARLGAKTRFICRLGADKYGLDALKLYAQYGISTDRIKIDTSTHSGISIILIDKNGNNLISVAPGANFNLSEQDIDNAGDVLKDSMIVGFQLENDFRVVSYGIKKAHDMNIRTFLDPAPALKLPDDIFRYLDIIKPNETEASTLTGINVSDVKSAEKAGKWLTGKGVKTVIVTLGEKGAVLVTPDETEYFPAPKVSAIDTTGAGDIFSGAFFYYLQNEKNVKDSIKFAIAAASLSTTKIGVIESIPDLKQIQDFINNHR